jgi:hypothetical protein
MKALGYFTATLFVLLYAQLLNGFALATLWAWFVVPTFQCVSLSIPAAIGISTVVGYLTHQVGTTKKDEKYEDLLARAFGHATAKPVVALSFGFVVKWFV